MWVTSIAALALVLWAYLAAAAPGDDPSGEGAVCPATTFVRASAAGAHQHCICPSSYICEGCAEGCEVDRSPYKERCVMGFKPSCGDECRCQPGKTKMGFHCGQTHSQVTYVSNSASRNFCALRGCPMIPRQADYHGPAPMPLALQCYHVRHSLLWPKKSRAL